MKKKILVVFVGGTICTTVKGNEMSADPLAATALIEFYKRSTTPFKDHVEFCEGKNFGILSENMTVNKWNEIIEYLQGEYLSLAEFDGIVIAHGTDTLAFSTALFSVLLSGLPVPVFFVSSNYPIMLEDGSPNLRANGVENFRAAVDCICLGVPSGVYAPYKNPKDQRMYLHRGAHLTQCQIYDENFYSSDALDITDFNGVDLPGWASRFAVANAEALIGKMKGKALKDCVLKISPYVGLNYDMFNLEKPKAVLHGTYHSGTACVVRTKNSKTYDESSILHLLDRCAERGIPLYLSPAKTGGESTVYDSVSFIENHEVNGQSVRIYFGQTDELLHAKLLLAHSLGLDEEQIGLFIETGQLF